MTRRGSNNNGKNKKLLLKILQITHLSLEIEFSKDVRNL